MLAVGSPHGGPYPAIGLDVTDSSLAWSYSDFEERMKNARELSWENFGKKITFYLPGMIKYNNKVGKYPAISITGNECKLMCDHCRGKLLAPMLKAATPEKLIYLCEKLEESGNIGILLTGGSDEKGVMPWKKFAQVIRKIKDTTNLKISIHSGIIDDETASQLVDAGVDQALIDVIGSDQTLKDVYHLDEGIVLIEKSLESLYNAGINTIPHIVIGLHFGKIVGENKAIEMLERFDPEILVFVVLTSFKGTPMEGVKVTTPKEVVEVILDARFKLPETLLSLGCERSRGLDGFETEILAINSGINRIAIQSEYAVEHAKCLGLEIVFKDTCCSIIEI